MAKRKTASSPSRDAATGAVLNAVRRLVQNLRVSARAAEERVGVSGAQLYVLSQLAGAEGPLSVNELAERTMTHQSSVSVVVRKLESRGLVQRATSPVDGRRVELSPTAAATTLLRKAPEAAQERLIAALESMPARRRAELARLMQEMVRGIGGDQSPPPLLFEDAHPLPGKGRRRGRS